jgi:hypothetical protein
MIERLSKAIRNHMQFLMDIDPLDNATILAEEAAWAFDRGEWLDDPDHEVWEIALEFFD